MNTRQSHHGVFMAVADVGVVIIGKAGVGKSSFALELLSQGHRLIADDVIDFDLDDGVVTGHCPALLQGLLHTHEMGLISITNVFGKDASIKQYTVNYVVELIEHPQQSADLDHQNQTYSLLNQSFPLLKLSTHNPCSLTHRLLCWLKMQSQSTDYIDDLQHQQQAMMLASANA